MANDLGSYRRKYRAYRGDFGLRELHRLHPTLHVWDDHEVENNYTDNRPPPAALQRTAGYRAAFEWIPRVVERRDRFRIYKRLPMGAFAEVFLLDERQYRTGDEDGRPRKLLGDTQMEWFINALKTSTAQWKLVANQVAIAHEPFGDGESMDRWDGYPEDRFRVLSEIERAGIQNVVFLTGDSHVFSMNLLASDFQALGDGSTRKPSAVEYVGGSITSPGQDRAENEIQTTSPWIRQFNGRERGYALSVLDNDRLITEYRRSDVSRPDGATTVLERFTQPAGANNASRESFATPV
jgi:alkaline phosphatase D